MATLEYTARTFASDCDTAKDDDVAEELQTQSPRCTNARAPTTKNLPHGSQQVGTSEMSGSKPSRTPRRVSDPGGRLMKLYALEYS